jgi:hypothetical protein
VVQSRGAVFVYPFRDFSTNSLTVKGRRFSPDSEIAKHDNAAKSVAGFLSHRGSSFGHLTRNQFQWVSKIIYIFTAALSDLNKLVFTADLRYTGTGRRDGQRLLRRPDSPIRYTAAFLPLTINASAGNSLFPYKVSPRHIGNSLLYCW